MDIVVNEYLTWERAEQADSAPAPIPCGIPQSPTHTTASPPASNLPAVSRRAVRSRSPAASATGSKGAIANSVISRPRS